MGVEERDNDGRQGKFYPFFSDYGLIAFIKVYHATCHSEMTSSNSLAVRLRTELAFQMHRHSMTLEARVLTSTPASAVEMSPSSTPEAKLAGSKRKVEELLSMAGNNEDEDYPPPKKVAPTVA